jgi:ferric-dicitrate binding protein FerR (iron transport regulator)
MASRRKKVAKAAKAVPFSSADLANITKANPYVQRLIEDSTLRDNITTAIDSTKSAFSRLTSNKAPQKAIFEDKKLQKDLQTAAEAARDAVQALNNAPAKRKAKKGLRLGRKLLFVGVAAAAGLAGSEKLRSKVLDTLFGAEEEFQYTPPAPSPATPPASPVTAA